MKFHFHAGARRDLKQSYSWYQKHSDRAASEFLEEVSATLDKISNTPGNFHPITKQGKARAVRMDRYPFNLIYLPSATNVIIIAVAHDKRRPDYWQRRID
jgi:plasmid stabilization system protein ParE